MRTRRRDPVRRAARRRRRACARMLRACRRAARTADGLWARGPVALGHRRLKIIDLQRGRRAADGRRRARADAWSSTAASTTTRSCATSCRRTGYRFFSTSDTEVILKAYPRWGADCVDHFLGHVRLRDRRARQRPADAGPRPAGHQAAVPRPDRRPAAVRLDAAGAAGRRRHRHLDRPGRAGPLHDVPLGRAGAADHPDRRPQAAAGHGAGDRAGRHVAPTPSTGSPLHPRPATGRTGDRGLAGRAAGQPADRRRAADGRRRAGRGAALRRHRLQRSSWRCSPSRAARPDRRSASGSSRPAARAATSSSTPTWSPSSSAPTTTRSGSTARGCCPASTRPSPR